ncbi:MAG TPA: cell division protein ZapA [Sphingomonas sp.]|nr:cell division protein ZapA [Sphingomonas sp.]
MAMVTIEVGGREHEIMCRDGEEGRLKLLARMVEDRVAQVVQAVGRSNEVREMLLAALLLADDLDEAQAGRAPPPADPREAEETAHAIEAVAQRLERLAARLAEPVARS